MPGTTPNQTVGPFFHLGMVRDGEHVLVAPDDPARIRIAGRVIDGAGDPVPDALIEIWQANSHGRYRHPADDCDDLPLDESFAGAGRCATDAQGSYMFETVKPGAVRGEAPHVVLQIFARGLLIHFTTRCYFGDESANDDDPVLQHHVPSERRHTLIAAHDPERDDPSIYHFDIVLQGANETVFFDV